MQWYDLVVVVCVRLSLVPTLALLAMFERDQEETDFQLG